MFSHLLFLSVLVMMGDSYATDVEEPPQILEEGMPSF